MEGGRGAGWNVMRGVVWTDRFHATPAVFSLLPGQRVDVGAGAPLLEVVATPRRRWTFAPYAEDRVGAALARAVTREETIEHALQAGDALVASNHRMLHGRRPFEGDRELVRLLIWLEQPLAADARLVARARTLSVSPDAATLARLRAVLAILRGVPPAKVANEARVAESTLYAWRDAFMQGGLQQLTTVL